MLMLLMILLFLEKSKLYVVCRKDRPLIDDGFVVVDGRLLSDRNERGKLYVVGLRKFNVVLVLACERSVRVFACA